jgi:transcriptional regulator with XRE-family HTH domain
MTQEQLCERAGISADAVSRIEGGSRVPTLDTLERLSGAFAVSPSAFFEGSAKPTEAQRPTAVRRILSLLEGQPDPIQRLAVDVVTAIVRAFAVGSDATVPRRRKR